MLQYHISGLYKQTLGQTPKPFLFYNGNDAATLAAMTASERVSKRDYSPNSDYATMMMIADHRRRCRRLR